MSNKIGRNDPCPCGSSKKYKRCCFSNEQQGHRQPRKENTTSCIEMLTRQYEEKHNLRGMWFTFANRHITSCLYYGTKTFDRCDCRSVPKLYIAGSRSHEIYDPTTGEVAYLVEE